jgi:hypothetical protein
MRRIQNKKMSLQEFSKLAKEIFILSILSRRRFTAEDLRKMMASSLKERTRPISSKALRMGEKVKVIKVLSEYQAQEQDYPKLHEGELRELEGAWSRGIEVIYASKDLPDPINEWMKSKEEEREMEEYRMALETVVVELEEYDEYIAELYDEYNESLIMKGGEIYVKKSNHVEIQEECKSECIISANVLPTDSLIDWWGN